MQNTVFGPSRGLGKTQGRFSHDSPSESLLEDPVRWWKRHCLSKNKDMHSGAGEILSVKASHLTKNQLAKIIFNMLRGQFTENQFALGPELLGIAWQK